MSFLKLIKEEPYSSEIKVKILVMIPHIIKVGALISLHSTFLTELQILGSTFTRGHKKEIQ